MTNNPYYKDIIVNQNSLCSLPDSGITNELLSVETKPLMILNLLTLT